MWKEISFCVIVFIFILVFAIILPKKKEDNKKNYLTQSNKSQQEKFGKDNEFYVALSLKEFAKQNNAYLLNDFTFKDDDGFSTNIDHILITTGGIFIIETKSNKGIIYGKEEDEYWEAYKKEGQEIKKFKNPIKQNIGHINHLKKLLGNNSYKMYSLVIFPVAKSISNVQSFIVHDIESAKLFITEKIKESKYSTQYVKRAYKDFISIKNKYGITLEEHVENIEQRNYK